MREYLDQIISLLGRIESEEAVRLATASEAVAETIARTAKYVLPSLPFR